MRKEPFERLAALSKEELIGLIEISAKNLLALDGVWFQSVEQRDGMDAAMAHDGAAWARYTAIEARRIKTFLGLEEHPGLEGLARALGLRFSAQIHEDRVELEGDRLTYTILRCRVQTARARKGMPLHPCAPVGLVEYGGFAREIDSRITCRRVSCYPDVTDESCSCKWEFRLEEET